MTEAPRILHIDEVEPIDFGGVGEAAAGTFVFVPDPVRDDPTFPR